MRTVFEGTMDSSVHESSKGFTVCFMIATTGPGKGGHYGSLKVTAEALSRIFRCFIVDVGDRPTPVASSAAVPYYHVPFAGCRVIAALREILCIFAHEHPNAINVFDRNAYLLAHIASIWRRIPLVQTKCGGGPARRMFPYSDRLIVYSKEDQELFARSKRFRRARVALIPNRTTPFEADLERMAELQLRIRSGRAVVLRIARFTPAYEESMMQAVNLVRRLNRDCVDCQLVIIGVVQDSAVHKRVMALADENVHIFTDDRFTLDAKALIDVADLVIGTGRGFMEAASRGKVLLTTLAEKRLPVLVTADTFQQLFASNFSPRNQLTQYSEEDNYHAIRRVLQQPWLRQKMEALALRWNAEYFEIDSALDKHRAVYHNLTFTHRLGLSGITYGVCNLVKRNVRSVWHRLYHK